jgi:flagellar basal body-associated protein FliL
MTDEDMIKRMDEWNDPPEQKETSLWVGLLALLIIFLIGVSLGWFAHILL